VKPQSLYTMNNKVNKVNTMTKKIVIENCKECPFMEHYSVQTILGRHRYYMCQHPATFRMLITDDVECETINEQCALQDD